MRNSNVLERKIRNAQQLIENIASKGRVVVNFSGGRDSVTVLLLAKKVCNPIAWFMESSIDFPETLGFVKNVCKRLKTPLLRCHPNEYQGDFYTHVRRWGYFPTIQKNWCNGRLKIRPQRAKMRKLWGFETIYKLTGIRKGESHRRLYRYSKGSVEADPEHSGSFMVHPILNWSKKDVSEYLRLQGMEDHKGYKVCGVSGCYWCPFYQRSIILRISRVYPHIYDGIITLEKELQKPSLQGYEYVYRVLEQTSLTPYLN